MDARMPLLAPLMALAVALGGCGGSAGASGGNSVAADPAAARNLAAAQSFLAAMAKNPGVVTLPDGLEYQVVTHGTSGGASPTASDYVEVNYEARLPSGVVVDSSYQRGQPSSFQVGRLVPAWTEALQLMKPGDTWMLYSPPNLGYGAEGAGPIPPDSALVFKIELIRVLPPGSAGGPG
jgi:peptidylprolyl isomerase/FKBP-type peptidyl-prolyl cis-trans isomerase FklB